MKKMKIKEFAEVISGSTPKTNVPEYWNGDYCWITPAEICSERKYIYDTERKITIKGIESSNLKELKEGTVLLTSRAPIGKVAISKINIYCNQGFKAIVCNRELAFPDYIYYWLCANNQYLNSLGRGATFKEISKKIVEDIEVPLPDLNKQVEIANILDQAQELIDKRKAQIEALDELIQSVFYDMFGDPIINPKKWRTRKLSEIASINMGQSPKGDSYNEVGEGVPLLNGPTEFGIRNPIEKQWTNAPTRVCKKGDILFCVRGATAGRMNFADKEYCIGRGLAAINATQKVSNNFLYFVLKIYATIFQQTSNGSTFINVNKEQISNVLIFDTPDELQDKFINTVKSIEKQKELLNKSLVELENNFNSLMQRAFNGEPLC